MGISEISIRDFLNSELFRDRNVRCVASLQRTGTLSRPGFSKSVERRATRDPQGESRESQLPSGIGYARTHLALTEQDRQAELA